MAGRMTGHGLSVAAQQVDGKQGVVFGLFSAG
jgi:hypothetical protein